MEWKDFLEKNDQFEIVVHEDQLKTVLKDIGNRTDEDTFVIDSKTKERVKAKDEDDIRLDEVGVIASGSKVFIKKNIASFSEYLIEKNTK